MTAPDNPFAAPGPGAAAGYGPAAGPAPYPGYGSAPGYGPPPGPGSVPMPYAPPVPAAQTDGTAIAALVLAICSFVVFPFVPAVVALVLASSAARDIEDSGGRLGGENLVSAARIVAWINIGLCIAVAVLLLGLLALPLALA